MSAEQESKPLIRQVNREQLCWHAVDVEQLVGEEHAARAIWRLVGSLDLHPFEEQIASNGEQGGRPAFDPQLMISLWVYAYSVGIGSAREIARRSEYDPAFQWLCGLEAVNYHTLASFRTERREQLEELFIQVLGVMSAEGLVKLEQVMQDGTKIQAQASRRSFHREASLRQHLELARQQIAQMGDPLGEGVSARVAGARQRAQRERAERLEQAMEEMQRLRACKPRAAQQEPRVSVSEPEARTMKWPQTGFGPSYNVQVSADAEHKIILSIDVVKDGNDRHQLLPAVDRIEQQLGRKPEQMVADGDFTTRANIEAMQRRGVDYVGSLRKDDGPDQAFVYDQQQNCYHCPQNVLLRPDGSQTSSGITYRRFRAKPEDCQNCAQKLACCGNSASRNLLIPPPSPALDAFRAKMQTEEAKAIYRRRGPVVEFCNLWIKCKLNLQRFHLRGLLKAHTEVLWGALTYNLKSWIRLRKMVPNTV